MHKWPLLTPKTGLRRVFKGIDFHDENNGEAAEHWGLGLNHTARELYEKGCAASAEIKAIRFFTPTLFLGEWPPSFVPHPSLRGTAQIMTMEESLLKKSEMAYTHTYKLFARSLSSLFE